LSAEFFEKKAREIETLVPGANRANRRFSASKKTGIAFAA